MTANSATNRYKTLVNQLKKKSGKKALVPKIWQINYHSVNIHYLSFNFHVSFLLWYRPLDLLCVCLVTQLCPTLWDFMNCSPPGSSVHGILQARILEWVAIPFPRGSSQHKNQIQVSCIAGWFFTITVTRDAPVASEILVDVIELS